MLGGTKDIMSPLVQKLAGHVPPVPPLNSVPHSKKETALGQHLSKVWGSLFIATAGLWMERFRTELWGRYWRELSQLPCDNVLAQRVFFSWVVKNQVWSVNFFQVSGSLVGENIMYYQLQKNFWEKVYCIKFGQNILLYLPQIACTYTYMVRYSTLNQLQNKIIKTMLFQASGVLAGIGACQLKYSKHFLIAFI